MPRRNREIAFVRQQFCAHLEDQYAKLSNEDKQSGTAGACALLLAPLQFLDWLRTRFTKMHRIVGWFYVSAVFVLAPIGDYIQYLDEKLGFSRSFTIATSVDAVLLMTTTAIALYFILNRKIQQHRQWMTRSYAVALVFFEVRFISGVLGPDDSNAAGEVIIWICLVAAIPLADVRAATPGVLACSPAGKGLMVLTEPATVSRGVDEYASIKAGPSTNTWHGTPQASRRSSQGSKKGVRASP